MTEEELTELYESLEFDVLVWQSDFTGDEAGYGEDVEVASFYLYDSDDLKNSVMFVIGDGILIDAWEDTEDE